MALSLFDIVIVMRRAGHRFPSNESSEALGDGFENY